MIDVAGVHKRYGEPVLRGVDLSVAEGEQVFLVGPSGCGKSTLLRCIAGLETPDAGTVRLGGHDMDGIPTHRRRIGFMFQEPALFPHMDVADNVAFSFRYQGISRRKHRDAAMPWLEMVGLAGRADADVETLSGGQRQRVALARTLAARPNAVLLDEPLSALDRALRDEVGLRIRDVLKEADVPALWVSHDEEEAARLGDRIVRMVEGQVQ